MRMLSLALLIATAVSTPLSAQVSSDRALTYLGLEAVSGAGEKLGGVDNLLVGPDGTVRMVIVKAPLFMGLWDCWMEVPAEKVSGADDRRVVLDLTRREFNGLREWDPKKPSPDLKPVR